MHGVGNQELTEPTVELTPLDGEFVGPRQQKANDDTPRIPIVRKTHLIQIPAARYGVLCIEAEQSGLRAYSFDSETQPVRFVPATVGS